MEYYEVEDDQVPQKISYERYTELKGKCEAVEMLPPSLDGVKQTVTITLKGCDVHTESVSEPGPHSINYIFKIQTENGAQEVEQQEYEKKLAACHESLSFPEFAGGVTINKHFVTSNCEFTSETTVLPDIVESVKDAYYIAEHRDSKNRGKVVEITLRQFNKYLADCINPLGSHVNIFDHHEFDQNKIKPNIIVSPVLKEQEPHDEENIGEEKSKKREGDLPEINPNLLQVQEKEHNEAKNLPKKLPSQEAIKQNIINIVKGGLTPKEIETLQNTPDLINYIKENPTIFDEDENEVTEFVFVQVARKNSPCAQNFFK